MFDAPRFLGNCICGERVEDSHCFIRVEDNYFCDWYCIREWVKKEFEVFEND